jgi:serine/threonine protein kinase
MPSLGPGAHVGPYEIVSVLGAGGMGEVYRAHDSKLGREVAIKIVVAAERVAQLTRRLRQEYVALKKWPRAATTAGGSA